MSVAVILLAGGKGLRMGSAVPKQYLPLKGKLVSEHSYDLFLNMLEVHEIVVVCTEERRKVFERAGSQKNVVYAQPGERRQDSVFNGLQKVSEGINYICVHDSARPCLSEELARDVICAGKEYGAAALGLPVKYTVKETEASGLVKRTLERENIWEVQTPQVLALELFKKGFSKADKENLTVTDDVSLAELLGSAVKLVKSSSKNIKITTPDDLTVVESLLECKR